MGCVTPDHDHNRIRRRPEDRAVYQKDAEVLFPTRVIVSLRYLRSSRWQALVEHVISQSESTPDALAFSLMMIRLNGCLTCRADNYRAMRGCTLCAHQTVTRFRGADSDLICLWEVARAEILTWFATGEPPPAVE
jgi:hypothetical protein